MSVHRAGEVRNTAGPGILEHTSLATRPASRVGADIDRDLPTILRTAPLSQGIEIA